MKRTIFLTTSLLALFLCLAATPAAAGPMMQSQSDDPPVGAGAEPALTDINSASVTELRALPGIGKVYATKIVEGRPYESVEDLRTRDVLPRGTYAKIQDLVAAEEFEHATIAEPDVLPPPQTAARQP